MPDDRQSNRRLALPEGPLFESCLAALSAVLGYAVESLDKAATDPVAPVHEYRKSLRRARSLVRMLRPLMSKRLRRAVDVPLKESHRSLSGARDRAVLLNTWRALSAATGVEVDAIDRGLQSEPPRFKLGSQTRRDFDDLIALLAARLDPDIEVADLGRGVGGTYRAARRELRRATNVPDPAHVHALRRRCKDLNYQLEALGSRFANKRLQAARKTFSSLATDIGEITDLYQLRAAIAGLGGPIDVEELNRANAAVAEAIELKRERCLEIAGDALADKPKTWVKGLKLA